MGVMGCASRPVKLQGRGQIELHVSAEFRDQDGIDTLLQIFEKSALHDRPMVLDTLWDRDPTSGAS